MRCILPLVLALCSTAALAADDFPALAAKLNAAHKAGDYAAMVTDAQKLLALRPGYPRLEYLLAVARVHRGDAPGTLEALGRVADAGLYIDLPSVADFAPLKDTPAFEALVARFAALRVPVAKASPGFRLTEPDFIPEGITYDPVSGDFFVASVHLREIARMHGGQETIFAGPAAGLWSVLGIKADPVHGALWAVTSALPQMAGYDAGLKGRSALYCFDLKTGAVQGIYPMPADGTDHELNDLTVAPDGTVYVADGNGGVYILTPDAKALVPLTAAGALESAQGLALSPDGRYLYISDYERGLYAYDFADKQLLRLKVGDEVSDYYVDGLCLHGRDLVGIQNAVDPQRVTRFRLSPDGLGITDAEVLDSNDPLAPEPTLETVVGDELYFVANSQWSRFDDAGHLPPKEQLQPPSIVKLSLD